MNLNLNILSEIPRFDTNEDDVVTLRKQSYVLLSDNGIHVDLERVSLLQGAREALNLYGVTYLTKMIIPELVDCETTEEALVTVEILSDKALTSLNNRISNSFKNLEKTLRNSINLQNSMKVELVNAIKMLNKIYSPVWSNEDREFGIPEVSVTRFFSIADKHLDAVDKSYSAIINNVFKKTDTSSKTVIDDVQKVSAIDVVIDTQAKKLQCSTVIKDAIAISKKIDTIIIANKRIGKTISKFSDVKNMTDENRIDIVLAITNANAQISSINRVTMRFAGVYVTMLKNMGLQKSKG